MMGRRSGVLVVAIASAAVSVPRPLGVGAQAVVVDPADVAVTMVYRGAAIHVAASVPDSAEVAIIVQGSERRLALKRKGKVLGLVWMNVGDVTFEGVPNVYLLQTSCPLVDLADPTTLRQLGIGFGSLGHGAAVNDPVLRGELVRLKERDGLWDVAEETVTLTPGPGEATRAAADFFLPAKASPGEYRVLAYAFEKGAGRLIGETRLTVSQGGGAAIISALALHHGLLYGILAVAVAAAAGLATGVVFGLGSGRGH